MINKRPQSLEAVNSTSPSIPSDGPPNFTNTFDIRLPLERFRGFFDALSEALVATDQQGQILYVNGQAEQEFGYGREELVGNGMDTKAEAEAWCKANRDECDVAITHYVNTAARN